MAKGIGNLIHTAIIRIANLRNVSDAFQETNRKRICFPYLITTGTAKAIFSAPWDGRVAAITVTSPTTTSSDGSNTATFEVSNVTQAHNISVYDTYTGGEFTADVGQALPVNESSLSAIAITDNLFNAGDTIALEVTITGTPNMATGSYVLLQAVFEPTDKAYAF